MYSLRKMLRLIATLHSIGILSILFCAMLQVSVAAGAQEVRLSLQPLAQQARNIETTLAYLGQPMSRDDQMAINQAIGETEESAAVSHLQEVLDKYALAIVDINPESRVRVAVGAARPELVEAGIRIFLVKVINKAGVTARLEVESPNALPIYLKSDSSAEPPKTISTADILNRWMSLDLYDKDPMSERLSGMPVEYQILEIYSRDKGQRAATISFNVGQGTQDIGFRNELNVLFTALPSHPLQLEVRDQDGLPSIAAFTIRDALGRLYPNPSKRLAPDLYFQPQVYRANGETILVPEGSYTVICSMGPEYRTQTKQVEVAEGKPNRVSFAMTRWIDPAKYGWYSGDHHVHAAGCSHYQDPSQGIEPKDMVRQIQGEQLNVGAVLTWGPCFYYQKQFFSGKDDSLSRPNQLMHYDLEVSGFPSSHAGHLVLLGLKDQEYPHCVRISQWPTWDLPILRWAKSQGAVTGFAHSGLGLEVSSGELPNYEIPSFDSIGANEYIVDVTFPDTVDFISTMDTPYLYELNIWYHTLNVGFRTRISGETDFPCMTDARVGKGRVYAKVDGQLTYAKWLNSIRAGRSYVSDGRSHLIDFSVNGLEVGTNASELQLKVGGTVHVRLKVSASLSPAATDSDAVGTGKEPSWMTAFVEAGQPYSVDSVQAGQPYSVYPVPAESIHNRPLDQEPFWHIERARIKNTREVSVELVVNGKPVDHKNILADGSVRNIAFDVPIERSSWVAVRILGSSHTNPIFILVNGKPIRASRRSAQWCLAAVNQCWSQKARKISEGELADARAAYDHAREVYTRLMAESDQ